MSEQRGWLSREAADYVLTEFRQLIAEFTAQVHAAAAEGDDAGQRRDAYKAVVWRMQEAERAMQVRLRGAVPAGVAAVPEPDGREVGEVTDEVLRRLRKNAGGPAKHRAKR